MHGPGSSPFLANVLEREETEEEKVAVNIFFGCCFCWTEYMNIVHVTHTTCKSTIVLAVLAKYA